MLVVTLLLTLCAQTPPAQATPAPPVPPAAQEPSFAVAQEQAVAALNARLEIGIGPGFAAAVGHAQREVWSQGFGYAHVAERTKVTDQTLFRVGSVSKPLTAAGLMLLVEEGKLDLDAEVQQYVPTFPRKLWPLTTRQLAGHLGGVRHYRGAEFLSRTSYPSVTAGLHIFADDPLLHQPGSRYAYSSYGWNLVSAAIEGASDTPFLEYMQQRVFKRLGLSNTRPDHAQAKIAQRTHFYANIQGGIGPAPAVDNSYKWAGGGFLSTPSDLVRFAQAHLRPGFLKQASLDALFTPQHTRDGRSTGYGIGWTITKNDDFGAVWGHSGGSVGGSTQLLLLPDLGLVVALTLNNSEGPTRAMTMEIARFFAAAVQESRRSG